MKKSQNPETKKEIRNPDIAYFEDFLKAVGFKRTDGSIFGLLVLSSVALSSEEIGKTLGLSQGGVSQGLKSLSHWGAIESRYSSERRVQLHSAVSDSLSIVATIFQKREKGAIEAFRRANESARVRFLADGDAPNSDRIQRLNSYITTCEFAQVIMDFAITLSRFGVMNSQYSKVIRALPKVLDTLTKGTRTVEGIRKKVIERVKEKRWL